MDTIVNTKSSSSEFKFTMRNVHDLPSPTTKKLKYYRDTDTKGLILCVSQTGNKSFQVYKKVNGQPVRVTLGKFPGLSVENARKKATKVISQCHDGINPNKKKAAERSANIELKQVFDDYLKSRKNLKEGTKLDYNRIMDKAFDDWHKKPIKKITKDLVENKHRKLGIKSQARSNNAMRVLRALFNYAMKAYEDENGQPLITQNPVNYLSHTKGWFRVERRRKLIKTHELEPWFKAVLSLEDKHPSEQGETVKDYLLLLILTGLRREEAARLKWTNIDFKDKTLTVFDTKNREPHVLPLSNYLQEILDKRNKKKTNDYVFPSKTSQTGYLINAHKQQQKVQDLSGVEFSAHDLRRTFATIAEGLDINSYALKRLLNHKMKHDVTAGYIVMDIERLRAPMQQITDFILKAAKVKHTAEIVDIRSKQA